MVMHTCLYWIRLKEHTDITSQGYVGITNNFTKRMEKHSRCDDGSEVLYNAIKKYEWGNLIKTIILRGNEKYCLDIENKLRPSNRIGWNIAIGGGKPPTYLGNKNPSLNPEVVAKRQKTRNLRMIPYENIARGDNHPRVKNPELWANAIGEKHHMHRPEVAAKVSSANKGRKNYWIQGDKHPRKKNPELWANAIGEKHWTKNNLEFSERMKNNNPMKNPEVIAKLKAEGKFNSRKIRCVESGEIFNSLKAAAKSVNGNVGNICAACKGKLKTSSGFRWEYVI